MPAGIVQRRRRVCFAPGFAAGSAMGLATGAGGIFSTTGWRRELL
jgi:hypothetical protein